MKTCFKCGISKPFIEYYKHKRMADGRLNKCKECAKKDVNDNRSRNIEYYRAYDVNRYTVEKVRFNERRAYTEKWRRDNPEKHAAHTAVSNALRTGMIIKPSACEDCGDIATGRDMHGHHEDYSMQLDVKWLCVRCHAKRHMSQFSP